MAVEIERKFLVTGSGWKTSVSKLRNIRQAYICKTEQVVIRIRIDSTDGANLTIKTAQSGRQRLEYEYQIPTSDAEQLLALRQGVVVRKTRHEVPFDGLVWEIDVFSADNAGLVIAEVELGSPDQTFTTPEWLGKEVTDDSRFYSANLAVRPFRGW